jgi:D-arabinose 1-dehydrogenase-like Zn-dependent alcohol dehydrogenase
MHRQSLVDYGKPLKATQAQTPAPQGSEVLLRVSHCGVCHSDVHLQDGYFDLGGGQKLDVRGNRPLPFTLGHEIAGTVEAVGPDAKGVARGKFYAAYPLSAAASAACVPAVTSTCAMRPVRSASPSTGAMRAT